MKKLLIRSSHLESMVNYCSEQAADGIEVLAFDANDNQQALTAEEQLNVVSSYKESTDHLEPTDYYIITKEDLESAINILQMTARTLDADLNGSAYSSIDVALQLLTK